MSSLEKKYSSFSASEVLILLIFLVKLIMFNVIIKPSTLLIPGIYTNILGSSFLVFSCAFIFSPNLRKYYIFLISLTTTIVIVVNIWYIRYFDAPFSVSQLLQINNLTSLGPSILNLIKWSDLFFVLDLFLIPFLKFSDFSKKSTQKMVILFLVLGVMFFSLRIIKTFLNNPQQARTNLLTIFDRKEYILLWNPIVYTINDAINYLNNGPRDLTEKDKNDLELWYENHNMLISEQMKKKQVENKYSNIGAGKNLIIIQVESLENFVINKSIEGKEITPNLNSLLNHSVYFSRLYPQIKDGNSSDAELNVNTSLYPIDNGATFFRFPSNKFDFSLPNLLKDKGYKTMAFHGDESTYWNRKQVYPFIGYDAFYGIESFDLNSIIGMGLGDRSFFEQSFEIIKKNGTPFLSYLITLSSHTPFEIPDDQIDPELEKIVGQSEISNYLESINYTDRAIGEFVNKLKKDGILDQSMVVIFGDHYAFNNSIKNEMVKENSDLGYIINDGQIPLIIYNPELQSEVIDTIGGQVDILPTLSYIMGLNYNYDFVMGKNLFTTDLSFAVLPRENRVVFDDAKKLDYSNELAGLRISNLILTSKRLQ